MFMRFCGETKGDAGDAGLCIIDDPGAGVGRLRCRARTVTEEILTNFCHSPAWDHLAHILECSF
jgi:hypothetical protein